MIPKALVSKYIHPLVPVDAGVRPAGKLGRPPTGVLFDIYGTLFVSASGDVGTTGQDDARTSRLAGLLERYGLDEKADTLVRQLKTRIREEHRRMRLSGVDFPEVRIDRTWMNLLGFADLAQAQHFAVEFEFIVNPVFPMPNLATLLAFCRSHDLAMGIISNAQFYTPYLFHWFLDANLGGLGINPRLTFFSYRYGVAKPSPLLFQKAAGRLRKWGIPPGSVLYIGNDMRNDILPAAETGFMTALFAGDRRSLRLREEDPDCRSLAPDLVITDLYQLTGHL